jgi:hypothetical protein
MNKIPLNLENANGEIVARMLKSAASKYDCTMEIDFSGGKREAVFVGDSSMKNHIIQEVIGYFSND